MTGHQRHSRHDRIAQLRRELQEGRSSSLKRRRAIIVCSLVGMASLAAVSAFRPASSGGCPTRRWIDSDPKRSTHPILPISMASRTARSHWPDTRPTSCWRDMAAPPVCVHIPGCRSPPVSRRARRLRRLWWRSNIWFMKCRSSRKYCIVDAVMHIGTFALTVPETIGVFSTHRRQAEGARPLDE